MARRPTRGGGLAPRQRGVPNVGADRQRRVPPRPRERSCRAPEVAWRGRGWRPRDPRPRTAVDLPRRLRLHRLRSHGGAARPRPLHALPGRSRQRSLLPVHRLAVPALAVWTAVHARELRDRSARARGRAVDVQSRDGPRQPRGGVAHGAGGGALGRLRPLRDGLPGTESGAARAGRRRRPQRHVVDLRAQPRAAAQRRRGGPPSRRRARASGGSRGEADGGAGDALPRARLARQPPAAAGGGSRGARPRRRRAGRRDRLRPTCARLPDGDRGAAAARCDPQRAGGERAAVRSQRHPRLVAGSVGGGLPGGAGGHPLAHRAGRRLARCGGVGDDRPAPLHGLAAAVVCDLAAAPSGRLPRSAPAWRRAPALRLRRPDPPPAGRPPAQPCPGARRPAAARGRLARAARSR